MFSSRTQTSSSGHPRWKGSPVCTATSLQCSRCTAPHTPSTRSVRGDWSPCSQRCNGVSWSREHHRQTEDPIPATLGFARFAYRHLVHGNEILMHFHMVIQEKKPCRNGILVLLIYICMIMLKKTSFETREVINITVGVPGSQVVNCAVPSE